MEAIIVSPTPGPKAFKPNSNIENRSGSESTFAPTLDRVINEQKSSNAPKSKDTHSKDTVRSHKESDGNSSSTDLNEDSIKQANGIQPDHSNIESTEKVAAEGNAISLAATKVSAALKTGEAGFVAALNGVDNSNVNKAVSPEDKASQMDKTLPRSTQIHHESDPITQLLAKNTKESVVSAQFSQPLNNAPGITKEHFSVDLTPKTENTVYLKNNDSISWNHAKSPAPNLLSQNPTPLQFTTEDSLVSNSTAIRVERLTTSSELIAQNTSESTDKIPALSAERIAAKLTDIPVQTNQATTSLRDNTSSLRQDTHEQFVDAKLEHIDNKQHAQTDQQSLNSESDSSQKNSLGASPKNIERPNETSFSQSLHNISTDKPTNSGLDPLRPGGSVFTPQIQENHVLHQVLNKFRISQHLQDSRVIMKLHPAELGDLKIDVQLKEGTINANILAQSQQVQDILEKNMPRLKALMEEQGLMVNEITIKLDTDVSDNNMFEDHLAQDEKFFAARKNIDSAATFELEADESQEVVPETPIMPSGVNVMV